MRDYDRLIRLTQDFLDKHWGSEEAVPEWDNNWEWSGSVPNHKLGGLYALFSGEQLLYVGLGNSRGGGIYAEHGISRRLLSHVLKLAPDDSPVSYVPQERWAILNMDRVATIGFPASLSYLAPALEEFLIGRLNPPENSVKRKIA